jgi:hypothetical protein
VLENKRILSSCDVAVSINNMSMYSVCAKTMPDSGVGKEVYRNMQILPKLKSDSRSLYTSQQKI